MDWYYPVLAGVLTGSEARARLALRRRVFVHEGEGVRCVSNQDWVTTAETCECAMAYLAAGDRAAAMTLFEWAQRLREPDGSYLTGRAFPANVSYPDQECTTYSAAAVLLAADALAGDSPTSGLFVDASTFDFALANCKTKSAIHIPLLIRCKRAASATANAARVTTSMLRLRCDSASPRRKANRAHGGRKQSQRPRESAGSLMIGLPLDRSPVRGRGRVVPRRRVPSRCRLPPPT